MNIKVKHYFKLETFKNLISYALIAFGTIWLLIEFPSSVNDTMKKFFESLGDWVLIISIFLSLTFGIIRVFPKSKVSKKFNASNTSVEIVVGDIFKEKGNFTIGSSNYFDTNFEIANLSLKSQLINRCFESDIELLNNKILESIDKQGIKGKKDKNKPLGNKTKYPIGTTVSLNQAERQIFILIISKLVFEENRKHTISNPTYLNEALNKFWEFIKTEGRMKPISIPVFGSGLARVNLSFSLLIQLIVFSYVTYSKSTRISEKLKIIVYEKDYNPNDFEELKMFLKSIEI